MTHTNSLPPSGESEIVAALEEMPVMEPLQPTRGRGRRWLLRAGAVLLLVGAIGAGAVWLVSSLQAKTQLALQVYQVNRGELLVSITEDGNLESADNLDIKCGVAGGSTILWIVEDGKEVQEGEVLVRLDSAQLEDQINQQRINYEKARANYIQAEKNYEVSKIAVEEYLEGAYRQQLQDLEAKITIALENLRGAENSLQHTERMFRKGYVTPLQLETQRFAVERCKLDLALARTAKEVLERFTKAKTLQDLISQRDTAEAKLNSERASLDLEEARLKRLDNMLAQCVIRAPKAGMVVYANEQSRMRIPGAQGPEIKEGAAVRDQQAILRLPDLSKMQVKLTIHESKIERIRRGMRARVRVQGREFQGYVHSVANQPEPASFFSAQVKEYATVVRIEGESRDLRPGLTAEVEILVAHLPDVLAVPVAAVFEHGGQTYCYVKGSPPELRPVVLGLSNEKFIELKEGLREGEEVVLNPRALLQLLPPETPHTGPRDIRRRFGTVAGERNQGDDKGGADRAGAAASARPFDLAQFDKNGDRKLDKEELPAHMRGFFERLDLNGDGYIDQAELREARQHMRQMRPAGDGGPPRPPPTSDTLPLPPAK
jgi:multidrug efflux pump subunit AcrA (membrane-fusion protein)